jgi:hypothetical protein
MILRAQSVRPAAVAVDHLLLGVSDLDRGIEWVEQRTGVRAAAGGVHPGQGTRNALLSLGSGHYLEIIAPDPAQSAYNFQIDVRSLAQPRLINFAVTTTNIAGVAVAAREAGFRLFGPQPGSRQTVDGKTLRWQRLGVLNQLGSGGVEPVPFFIQWDASSQHPSKTAPGGCALEALAFEHPKPSELAGAFKTLGIEGAISQAEQVRIVATLKTPKGRVELS